MTATMRVIRADGAVETDQPMLFEQKEKKLVLDVFDIYFFAPTPWQRSPSPLTDALIKLARKISTDIGEPDRYTRPPFQLMSETPGYVAPRIPEGVERGYESGDQPTIDDPCAGEGEI